VRSSILSVPVQRFGRTPNAEQQDLLAVEEPLQIRIGEHDISITMRTPGHDAELAAGFLFTEGIIREAADIERIDCADNVATVRLAPGLNIDKEKLRRNFYMTSSCGVCGKASIESLEASGCTMVPRGVPVLDELLIRSLPDRLRESQEVFDRTGGLHAAGLFRADGDLIVLREDVGRHNAVDKLVGRAFLDGQTPLSRNLLMVSGRASFELVQKAVMAGIPILAAVGAPSSLTVKSALRFGMTLIGFLRDDRFNVYSGDSRIKTAA
jgi:FdhD protein